MRLAGFLFVALLNSNVIVCLHCINCYLRVLFSQNSFKLLIMCTGIVFSHQLVSKLTDFNSVFWCTAHCTGQPC